MGLLELSSQIAKLTIKVNALCSKFCCKVKECLGIDADAGDADLFLNQQGEFVSVADGGGWSLEGNAGTDPDVNFVGTADETDLLIGRNGATSGESRIQFVEDGVRIENGLGDYIELGVGVPDITLHDALGGEVFLRAGVLIKSPDNTRVITVQDDRISLEMPSVGIGKVLVDSDGNGLSIWQDLNTATYNLNSYVDDAAADADVMLPSGGLYKLNADRTVYQKP